jgi:drug/metabolite transporter (DMT)-like permease
MAARSLSAALPLVLLVVTWCVMGELLQGLQDGWPRPWMLTYAIHSGYALALIPFAVLRRARLARGGASPLPPLGAVAVRALGLSVLSSCVAVAWYASLSGTSVAGNSAVYQSSSAFALLFSALLLGEKVTRGKVAACIVSLAGVALVAVGAWSAHNGRDTAAGYAWVLTSTALYALYEVVYSRLFVPATPDEEPAAYALLPGSVGVVEGSSATAGGSAAAAETSALVLGLMGAWTLVTQWPIFFVAAAAGLEPLALAPMAKARVIALAIASDAVYNLALLWAISTSSPFATSLATTLVVPATIAADAILHGTLPAPAAAVGTVLILGAVAALNAPPDAWAWLAQRARCARQ